MDLVLQVSQGCMTLQYPGQQVMRGFMGTKAEFDEVLTFTCSTSTKVQPLTPPEELGGACGLSALSGGH